MERKSANDLINWLLDWLISQFDLFFVGSFILMPLIQLIILFLQLIAVLITLIGSAINEKKWLMERHRMIISKML